MMGERLETFAFERSRRASSGIFMSAEISSTSLPERFRLTRAVQSARTEMSVMPLLERSSSVTSDLNSTPPSESSFTATVASSENTVQSGSAFSSSSSSVSRISLPRMSRVVRELRECSGSRLPAGFPER